ncbi:MAG: ParM/StbA family protein [Oscillospiraceae bacterium]|nr:ParM/StbA family protein [Oscillospiraceae bacterium]
MSKQLLVAIDPGFDAMKVIANGKYFKFVFSAVETDERKMSDYGGRRDFILYKGPSGETWRVGQFARNLIFDNKDQSGVMQEFYTEERFVSSEFTVGIRSAIAKAIDMTGLYNEQKDLDIRLIVALPHAVRAKYASTVMGLVAGEHSFYMTFEDEPERSYHFSIPENNVFTMSQTIAAILGETSDDNGYINQDKFYYLSNGPTLVIDGGYYTVGLVPVLRAGSVDDNRAESNTAHAMKNVNMLTANDVAVARPDIQHYTVEHLLSQGDNILRYINPETGKVERFDLAAIREEKIKEVCTDLIKHINQKYKNLLDFRYVLVTGGTGARFFPYLLDYYKGIDLMDDNHLLLTHPTIADKELPIEFAIAVGSYKGLCGKIKAAEAG